MNAIEVHFTRSSTAYEHFISSPDDGEALVGLLKQGLRYADLIRAQKLPFDGLKALRYYDA
jgi:hypothetical protein